MIIKYFPDTDTLHVAFTEREIVETVDFNASMSLDVDLDGNVVALTLEHASANVDLGEVSFQQIVAAVPQA